MSRDLFSQLWCEDAGVTAIEYALIGSIVATGLAGAVYLLGDWAAAVFVALAAAFP